MALECEAIYKGSPTWEVPKFDPYENLKKIRDTLGMSKKDYKFYKKLIKRGFDVSYEFSYDSIFGYSKEIIIGEKRILVEK